MAISTQTGVLAWQRASHFPGEASTQKLLDTLKLILVTQLNNPDLQVKEFDNLTGSDTVIADAACKIYGIVLSKQTATAAYFKGSDSASAASSTAPEVELRQNSISEDVLLFPDGRAMANGFTISSDTTSDGNTGSSAGDGARGFVILGAA
jgi:hypothetical protein